MRKLKNTLYITTQGTYLHKERETLIIKHKNKIFKQLPMHAIEHIFCFGNVLVSPFLMGFCGENGVGLTFFTENNRFLARMQGRQHGNVLLRRAQYYISKSAPVPIAQNIIAAKIQSSKRVLQRYVRNHGQNEQIQMVITALKSSLKHLKQTNHLNDIRGIEGEAAARYFGVFNYLLSEKSGFTFNGRNRRPPRDAVNALLSFLYSILSKEISGALQGVGLDPQVGFLHADRPGRDSLALDILEEFRAWWVDRMVINLINLQQVKPKDFIYESSGAVSINDETRHVLFRNLQIKKQEKIIHPFLQEEVEIGLLPHIQAMLLARHLRGDLEEYPSFLMR